MTTPAFSSSSYTGVFAATVRAGLGAVSRGFLNRHASRVISFRAGEERDETTWGFRGRRGNADLYYTAFGCRALHALCELQPFAEPLARWVQGQRPTDIIELSSRLSALFLLDQPVPPDSSPADRTEPLRTPDGGYGRRPDDAHGSTYQTFLALLCYDLLGQSPPSPEAAAQFVLGRQREDGGFAEQHAAEHGNTNATAAALIVCLLLEAGTEPVRRRALRFLASMQHSSGGWLATFNAPLPDLLSTYTALVALTACEAVDEAVLVPACRFAAACEDAEGGFMGGPWDQAVDVEYTYYGLGVLGIGGLHGIL